MLRIVGGWLVRLRLDLIVVLIIASIALTRGITEKPLVDWDEATYAEVAHEAVANNSYLNLTWNGDPYLNKPPMLFWMMAASFETFGESEWSARLPSVLMGLGTITLIYLWAGAVAGRLAGIFAGLAPLAFYFFILRGGRECATDAPLVFFSTLALYGLVRGQKNRVWIAIAGASCGLAILSKGLAGLIPVIVGTISLVALPGLGSAGIGGLAIFLGVGFLVAAPWYIYEAVTNTSLFWSTFVQQQTFARVVSHLEDNRRSGNYTLRTFMVETRFWWPVLIALAGIIYVEIRGGIRGAVNRIPPSVMLWVLWAATALGAACAVQTKLGWYILPSLIPVALLAGSILGYALNAKGRYRGVPAFVGTLSMLLILLSVPNRWRNISNVVRTERVRSMPSYFMAMRARELASRNGGGELYFAGIPLPTMVYYSGLRSHFASATEPEFQLTDANGGRLSIDPGELVLVTPDGADIPVTTISDEWVAHGPKSKTPPPRQPE